MCTAGRKGGNGSGNGQALKKSRKRVGKTVANFRCTSDDCKKTWASNHAWTSERFQCEKCQCFAKVVKYVDENCALDSYNCKCGENWQAIHDPKTSTQACYCGAVVAKEAGKQIRFGRHYFYQCNGNGCRIKWEDFCQGRDYGQRCTKCGSAGEVMNFSKGRPPFRRGPRRRVEHQVDGCDMCQILINQGVSQNCMRKKLVIFDVFYDQNGWIKENVVATEKY